MQPHLALRQESPQSCATGTAWQRLIERAAEQSRRLHRQRTRRIESFEQEACGAGGPQTQGITTEITSEADAQISGLLCR